MPRSAKAMRGSIVDRNGSELAFTIEARALTFQPVKVRKELADAKDKNPSAPDPAQRLREMIAARADQWAREMENVRTALVRGTGPQ